MVEGVLGQIMCFQGIKGSSRVSMIYIPKLFILGERVVENYLLQNHLARIVLIQLRRLTRGLISTIEQQQLEINGFNLI
jgi:hypothetical protein